MSLRPTLRPGEASAWAAGLVTLSVMAVQVGLFTSLERMCNLTGPRAGLSSEEAERETVASSRSTLVWLELAGPSRASAVRQELERRGELGCATKAVAADGLFIILYGAVGVLMTMLVARVWALAGGRKLAWALRVAAVLVLAAAVLDVVENRGLFRMIDDPARLDLAGVTAACAVSKFVLLAVAMGAAAIGGVAGAVWIAGSSRWMSLLSVMVGVGAAGVIVEAASTIQEAIRTMPGA